MDDFPAKIAGFLEETATKIRSLTVDRVASGVKWAAAGLVLGAIGTLIVLFLLIGLFRFIGELIGFTTAYAVIGGLFVVAGLFLRSKRLTKSEVASE